MTDRRRLPGGHLARLRDGKLLQGAIVAAGITQTEFARRVGCARSMISGLVRGNETHVREDLGAAICWVADEKPSDLFVMPSPAHVTGQGDAPDEGLGRSRRPERALRDTQGRASGR